MFIEWGGSYIIQLSTLSPLQIRILPPPPSKVDFSNCRRKKRKKSIDPKLHCCTLHHPLSPSPSLYRNCMRKKRKTSIKSSIAAMIFDTMNLILNCIFFQNRLNGFQFRARRSKEETKSFPTRYANANHHTKCVRFSSFGKLRVLRRQNGKSPEIKHWYWWFSITFYDHMVQHIGTFH